MNRPRSRSRRLAAIATASMVAFALSGCLQDPNETGAGAAGLEGYVDNAQEDGDNVVTILGAFGGVEKDNFEASLKAFEDESGIDIKYTEDTDFTTTIQTKVAASDPPDIAFFPQPGGLLDQARKGAIQPIDTFLDYDALNDSLVPGLLDYTNLNGRLYGAPVRLANKSVVWYEKEAWDKAGYKVPQTLDELYALADQIKADGTTPWCMAWDADQATGWVGTDWIEQLVLSTQGEDFYNDWIFHKVPFDDPKVVEAFDAFGRIAKGDGTVLGGAKGIINTPVQEAMFPAFNDSPPRCLIERQGSFAATFFPTEPNNVQTDLDKYTGVFTFPSKEAPAEGEAPPVLVGADYAALFNGNDEDSQKVMQFLTSDKFGVEWAQAGGWLSPHKTFDSSNYPDQTTKDIAAIAADAPFAVFDGSDVMPAEVGSGSFWTGMVEWVEGASSEEATKSIEDSWPE
ncbi:ABC transporter substrate-binding protein [Nocardioides sp.]|uniref:ABC transporter substrate-binding protein n=1 Tax=Nocardioides sp. TaxID=35761 RepID=UPI00271CC743|nr:ABC transporter substrate-binding protein [Nocardioides sp.]MDO9456949.1 ABC transporter substrate-binding protein [Nocardioides sp.]